MRCKILFSIAFFSCFLTFAFTKHSTSIIQSVKSLPRPGAGHASPTHCFFIPPENWDIADPSTLSPKVKMAFLKNSGKGFCPSINLAIEETDVSLTDYLKAVKAIHEQDRNNHWRSLGKVRTAAGLAQLTEIDSTTEWGPVRILQLILIKDKHVYVLTAAALKEEMSNYYKEIQSAFRSLTLSSDLLGNVPQLERREMLKQKQMELFTAAERYAVFSGAEERQALTDEESPPFQGGVLQKYPQSPDLPKNLFEDPSFQEQHWAPFQKTVLDNFGDMGAFWQILFLRNAHEKLLSLNDRQE